MRGQTMGEARQLPMWPGGGVATPAAGHLCELRACRKPIRDPRPGQRFCSRRCRMEAWQEQHPRVSRAKSPEERFRTWLDSPNGQLVYIAVMREALEAVEGGLRRWSINGIFEAVRWGRARRLGRDDENFVLNNTYRSRLARLLMRQEARLAGFFEVRAIHGGER